jgi:hypothetical protein
MLKKFIVVGAIPIACLFLVGVFLFSARSSIGTLPEPQGVTVLQGTIASLTENPQTISLQADNGQEVAVSLSASTTIINANGQETDFSSLKPGMEIATLGIAPNSVILLASSILISHHINTNAPVQPDTVFENSLIPQIFSITGLARGDWFFDTGFFYIRVVDGKGQLMMRSRAYPTKNGTSTELVPFTAWLSFDPPETATGTLIFEKVISSSTDERLIIPVRFATST